MILQPAAEAHRQEVGRTMNERFLKAAKSFLQIGDEQQTSIEQLQRALCYKF